MQIIPSFTTVAQNSNQGTIRFRAVMRNRGPFWLLFGQTKSDRKTSWLKRYHDDISKLNHK
jgi:hypothetical protein